MSSVAFIATEWGDGKGGINAFNRDLATNCGRICKGRHRITCCVLRADEVEVESARSNGVKLISLADVTGISSFEDPQALPAITALFRSEATPPEFVVGHDIFTGPIALGIADAIDARSAVFIHAKYASYKALQDGGDGARAAEKEKIQESIVRLADRVFGVGPLLTEAARVIASTLPRARQRRKVRNFIPGLPDISPVDASEGFSAFSFGRYDEDKNEIIKQQHLCIAAYSEFVKQSDFKVADKKLTIVGLSPDQDRQAKQRARLLEIAGEYAQGAFVIDAQAFKPRSEAWELLRKAHVSMMLSWHEGFGLVGWEAIAAGVPLLMTRNSGLYRHLRKRHYPLDGCFWVTTVRGGFDGINSADVEAACDKLLEMYEHDPEELRGRARYLRRDLLKQYSWYKRAKAFLRHLDPYVFSMAPEKPRRKKSVAS